MQKIRFALNLDAAAKYAIRMMEERKPEGFYYHAPAHSIDVVTAVTKLAEMEGIGVPELIWLKTAAYFHETGIYDMYLGHEQRAADICRKVLPLYGYSGEAVEMIVTLIMATALTYTPQNLLEEIICDADLDYLGRDDYFCISDKLRLEWEQLGVVQYNDREWLMFQYDFLGKHRYYTKAAKTLRDHGKDENRRKIRELLKKNIK